MRPRLECSGRLADAPRRMTTPDGETMAGVPLVVDLPIGGSRDDGETETVPVFVLAFGAPADELVQYAAGETVRVAGRLRLAQVQTESTAGGGPTHFWECMADSVTAPPRPKARH